MFRLGVVHNVYMASALFVSKPPYGKTTSLIKAR